MIPEFGTIFGQPVPAYFSALAVGFALATYLGARWAKRVELDHNVVIDVGLLSVIAGVLGARILHVLADGYFWDYVHLCTDPPRVAWKVPETQCHSLGGTWDAVASVCHPVKRDCFAWAAFWRGGLAYYGGLVAAIAANVWLLRKERFPIAKACDMAGMTIPIGLAFGRLGCFFAGCCFGTITHSELGMAFPPWSPASYAHYQRHLLRTPGVASLPVHPTQLYESLACALLAALCALVVYPRRRYDGQVFITFIIGYAALRFAIEYFRDDDRGSLFVFSTSQWLGILFVGLALAVHIVRRRSVVSATTPSLTA